MQTESNIKPDKFIIEEHNKKCDVLFSSDIEETERNGETFYTYNLYRLQMRARDNLEETISNNYETWLEVAKQKEEDTLAKEIRTKRNKLLAETDWTQMPDVSTELQEEYKTYRQELRDITNQEEFPYSVIFPQKP